MRKTLNTIKILGMKKDGSEFWYYIIEDNGNENWVIRDYIITHYPVTPVSYTHLDVYKRQVVSSRESN